MAASSDLSIDKGNERFVQCWCFGPLNCQHWQPSERSCSKTWTNSGQCWETKCYRTRQTT
eukprot:801498-Amphidinium_carterae.2